MVEICQSSQVRICKSSSVLILAKLLVGIYLYAGFHGRKKIGIRGTAAHSPSIEPLKMKLCYFILTFLYRVIFMEIKFNLGSKKINRVISQVRPRPIEVSFEFFGLWVGMSPAKKIPIACLVQFCFAPKFFQGLSCLVVAVTGFPE